MHIGSQSHSLPWFSCFAAKALVELNFDPKYTDLSMSIGIQKLPYDSISLTPEKQLHRKQK